MYFRPEQEVFWTLGIFHESHNMVTGEGSKWRGRLRAKIHEGENPWGACFKKQKKENFMKPGYSSHWFLADRARGVIPQVQTSTLLVVTIYSSGFYNNTLIDIRDIIAMV